ncbi:hypothetical protein BDZ91DRAFT_748320 [Kalaharituber pfeilii]|nr:hypothetical protein BDZ91DRAFT_748320 [Kalaharituber pfeilii]
MRDPESALHIDDIHPMEDPESAQDVDDTHTMDDQLLGIIFSISILFAGFLSASTRTSKLDESMEDRYQQSCQLNVTSHISGNADLYGIGVRIGLYLQLFVTAVLVTLAQQRFKCTVPLQSVNMWFLLALSVTAWLWIARSNGDVDSTFWLDGKFTLLLLNGSASISLLGMMRKCQRTSNCLLTLGSKILMALNLFSLMLAMSVQLRRIEPKITNGAIEECNPKPHTLGLGLLALVLFSIAVFYWICAFLWHLRFSWLILHEIASISNQDTQIAETVPIRRIYMDYLVLVPMAELHVAIYGARRNRISGQTSSNSLRESLRCHMIHHYSIETRLDDQLQWKKMLRQFDAEGPGMSVSRRQKMLLSKLPDNIAVECVVKAVTSINLFRFVTAILIIANTIIGVETQLIRYSVQNVNNMSNAGQLIALLVCVGGCLSLLPEIYSECSRASVSAEDGLALEGVVDESAPVWSPEEGSFPLLSAIHSYDFAFFMAAPPREQPTGITIRPSTTPAYEGISQQDDADNRMMHGSTQIKLISREGLYPNNHNKVSEAFCDEGSFRVQVVGNGTGVNRA